jgi:hypothetical protein
MQATFILTYCVCIYQRFIGEVNKLQITNNDFKFEYSIYTYVSFLFFSVPNGQQNYLQWDEFVSSSAKKNVSAVTMLCVFELNKAV